MAKVKESFKKQPRTKRKSVEDAEKYAGGTTVDQDAEKLFQGINAAAAKAGVSTKPKYNKAPATPSRKLKDVLGGLPLTPEVPKDVDAEAIRNYLGATPAGSKAKPGTFFSDNLRPLPGGAAYAVGKDASGNPVRSDNPSQDRRDVTGKTRQYVVAPVKLKGDIPGTTRTINMALRREQFSVVGGGNEKGKLTYTGRPGEIIPVNGELRKIKPAAPLKASGPVPKGSVAGKRSLDPAHLAAEVTVDPITERQNAERAARDAEREKNFVPKPGLPKGVTLGNQEPYTPTPYAKPVPNEPRGKVVIPVDEEGKPTYEQGNVSAEKVADIAGRMTRGNLKKGRTNVVTGTMSKVVTGTGKAKVETSYPTYTTSYVPKTAEELAAIPSTAPKTEGGKVALAAAKTPEQLKADREAAQGRADINAQKRAENIAKARANRAGPKI